MTRHVNILPIQEAFLELKMMYSAPLYGQTWCLFFIFVPAKPYHDILEMKQPKNCCAKAWAKQRRVIGVWSMIIALWSRFVLRKRTRKKKRLREKREGWLKIIYRQVIPTWSCLQIDEHSPLCEFQYNWCLFVEVNLQSYINSKNFLLSVIAVSFPQSR